MHPALRSALRHLCLGLSVSWAGGDGFAQERPDSAALLLPAYRSEGQKVLYGEDDRVEVYQTVPAVQRAAASVAALFDRSEVARSGGRLHLPMFPTGAEREWCPGEPFRDQPTTALCSGFLIAPDRVATAGHCIRSDGDPYARGLACSRALFVFGFRMSESGDPATGEVMARHCLEVVPVPTGHEQEDWRVVRIAPVSGRTPLPLAAAPPTAGEELTVLGHPMGLPLKVVPGGRVLAAANGAYFVSDLDAYRGNSGSPVFATDSLLRGAPRVVGMLSGGEEDFEQDPARACRRSRRCAPGDCRGEQVLLARALAGQVSDVKAGAVARDCIPAGDAESLVRWIGEGAESGCVREGAGIPAIER